MWRGDWVEQKASVFAGHATEISKMQIWNRRFSQIFSRLESCSLQKITATDDGVLVLGVYKPGDDRSAVLLSVAKTGSGITTSNSRPPSQGTPNSLVQQMRKYVTGKRVKHVYAALEPTAVIIELYDHMPEGAAKSAVGDANIDEPDCIVLDLGSRPGRICLCKKYESVPKRYLSQLESEFSPGQIFFESFCEWSLSQTRTKRRATFLSPFVTYSCVADRTHKGTLEFEGTAGSSNDQKEFDLKQNERTEVAEKKEETTRQDSLEKPTQPETVSATFLPVHLRRAVKTRLQFLERRLLRQRQDLPKTSELETLEKRALGLQSNLYMWPKGALIWCVPPDLIEEFGLPAMLQLKASEKPGELLNRYFVEIDKLKRRVLELKVRIAESEKALADFNKDLMQVLLEVKDWRDEMVESGRHKDRIAQVLASPPQPPSAEMLLKWLDVAWSTSAQKSKENDEEKSRRLPYRSFRASTGEFIKVAKSAADGDAMIKLMPTHHSWLHIMTGEGSHVWLEHPKKQEPSPQAIREAAILAVHHSKVSRSLEGEVYVTKRANIEKKKDLPPGKVIVRRAESLFVRYETMDLKQILEAPELPSKGKSKT
jgi:predicted ribosome quality control (RQC) complex YloA/Tae2 family protein